MSPEWGTRPPEAQQSKIDELGLEAIADLQIEAHGGIYSVRDALIECPPFAKMLEGMASSLADVPNRTEILSITIQSMATSTGELPPEAKKKDN
jgi:hypothetical protein